MRQFKTKKGSALLIVIGMLGFLIISAVAFSAYMRYSRLPSSYLRRSASSRQLVKAAMAEAIDSLDRAVNNNPHPGVGNLSTDGKLHNEWRNRVLVGVNNWQEPGEPSVRWDKTVSPLCLEALAYIPPTLVNEARYYSRLSPTAEWKAFDFDVGRYAFCVLDVSDYFDVNRMFANQRRTSASNQRVSLSYIFEDGAKHTGSGSGASQWDTFMEQFRDVDSKTKEISFQSKYPLISVADFNLALGQKGSIGKMKSPFVEYIKSTGSRDGFYDLGKNGNEAADDMVSRMTFVTDGLFPKTRTKTSSAAASGSSGNQNASEETYDLADADSQPFDVKELSAKDVNPNAFALTIEANNLQGKAKNEWPYVLSTLGCVSLYDYLDANRVPLSLATPTLERVPMVCGIHPMISDLKFAVTKKFDPENGEKVITGSENTREVEKTVLYKIDAAKFAQGFQSATLRALTVFPFSHKDENDGSYQIDGRMSFFFASEQMALRTGSAQGELRLGKKEIETTAIDSDNGMINFKLSFPGQVTYGEIRQEADAVKKFDSRIGTEAQRIATALALDDNALLKVVYRWTQHREDQNGITVWSPSFEKVEKDKNITYIHSAHTAFKPFKSNGQKDDRFENSEALKNIIQSGVNINLNCAFWLRIKDKDENIVDMVPACLEDDEIQNNSKIAQAKRWRTLFGDQPFPVLRFNTGVNFNFSLDRIEEMASNNAELDFKLEPSAAIVADPRHNHAPEEWFAFTGGALDEQTWLANNMTGKDGRDKDIFMATSDAGYLQSVYEFAFLPRFNTLKREGSSKPTNMKIDSSTQSKYVKIADTFEETRNNEIAWRTYDPFERDWEAFSKLPFVNEGTGFKVNPYSDSTNVMMSVFANTPLDWRCTSTNVTDSGVDFSSMNMDDFNKKYAFNAYSETAKIEWNVLNQIAGRFMDEVRRNGSNKSWEEVWRENMRWRDNGSDNGSDKGTRLCGFDLNSDLKLWDADKKYLYGFWKECFAVKQQLFLVFVRAEPMMMGSGAAGHTPPQLGGRAMALVWRDPTRAKNNNTPHKTRVLFYRQFD